ncbi:rRNA maturation RNase YbeY [Mongoliitalea daihaiensis]|uniref:rRNA maturation RNase YbeY n=1 Tax=Mongoliitalea daihaiensis TaxID=2782006 RepID=UPI001F1E80C2|nr:rRNA maturation RNase YbeY [Mongoliitalea daihaiensis]UJP65933.1 rRNA maturation RNase YbeY [Mongoliitalea daihaiensis]
MAIHFFEEDIQFNLKPKATYKKWLKELAQTHQKKIGELNYIFCSDEYLYSINVEYLNHHTYTDIITFDNSELDTTIEGDIFISIDRIKDNANKLNIPFETELQRVLSHGILHLLGYKDKKEEDQKIMRAMEEQSIALFPICST